MSNQLPKELADKVEAYANKRWHDYDKNTHLTPMHSHSRNTFLFGVEEGYKLHSIQPTCRWVKGSERKPEYEYGRRIYAKYRGAKIIILSQWGMWLFFTTNTSITKSDWDDIEWLEEELPSPPKETAGSQEGEMDIDSSNHYMVFDPQPGYVPPSQPSLTEQPVVEGVMNEIKEERIKQDAKWGEQNHAPADWLMILAEEVGEANRAALEAKFGKESLRPYREELIQVAAVTVAMIECFDRNDINKTSYQVPQPPVSDAVEFAEWINDETNPFIKHNGKWIQACGNSTSWTTEELYTLFKSQSKQEGGVKL